MLESPQSRRTDHFSSIVADREFSTGCYLYTVSNSGLLFYTKVCRPRPASHAHFRHVTDTFLNSLVVFGRPFVKRFALCYQTVVCPVCL